ncbi:esterase/lipase family protein [Marinicella gelatinilytica]|uniref:esterase/lipase family protein n=1 Tax=Marinicella gelatinilytica TaxID=2996017 RepID=UPI0022609DC1|nr:alpha/beta hydrolase [Marinicella gelatinilytica]MCX7545703.1 alpha/beta hydrolase [Marinicella gelatinilytica]
MNKPTSQAVVLVHGLWMKPWTWIGYRHFLEDHGFKVYLFGYKTTVHPFKFNVRRLAAFINSREEDIIHLVVHSMGGILAMEALSKITKPGKLLFIGSPINGSQVAQRLHELGWDKALLKHAAKPLSKGIKLPIKKRQTMMIAGDSPYGLGRFIANWKSRHDGTVALSETQADWLDEHRIVHTSHMGLLNNKEAKDLTLAFLQD